MFFHLSRESLCHTSSRIPFQDNIILMAATD